MHVRHEETAAFAAGAEAQVSGRLAACAGSCGPGNSLPPHLTVKQASGFALAMAKLTLSGHVDEVVDTIESTLRNA